MKFYGWKNELFAYKAALKYYRKLRYKEEERKKLEWLDKYGKKIKAFHNIHKGEDCFIIGNGPSLNKMNLELLKEYYTFGLNKIFLIWEKVDLSLDYFVAVNPFVIDQSIEEIKNLIKCPAFIRYNVDKPLPEKNHIFPIITNYGFGFSDDLVKGINEGGTVTYAASQIAFYMGFKRVFLIGIDHNFNQSGKENEVQTMKEVDANHFHPNYFTGQKWNLADLKSSEVAYQVAKRTYELNGRQMYDATIDGKLQIFEKISFEKALEIASKKVK